MEIIVGNLCSLLAMGTDVVSSSRKTAKGVLLVQCVSQLIYAIGGIILKGYSATVQNLVSILRNIAAIKEEHSKIVEWGLIGLGVVLGIIFNNRGMVGLLPVLANLEYSFAVFRFQNNEVALKIAFLVCNAMFAVFNIVILNFVGACANAVVFTMTVVFLLKNAKTKNN